MLDGGENIPEILNRLRQDDWYQENLRAWEGRLSEKCSPEESASGLEEMQKDWDDESRENYAKRAAYFGMTPDEWYRMTEQRLLDSVRTQSPGTRFGLFNQVLKDFTAPKDG